MQRSRSRRTEDAAVGVEIDFHHGGQALAPGALQVGQRDADIFGNNLLEVMQFVFNHTTFDPQDELDRALLAAYEPLRVVPGQAYDPAKVAEIDGAEVRKVSERIFTEEMAKTTYEEF